MFRLISAATLTAIGFLLCAPLLAQNAGKPAPAWTPPKTAWGHPDIEGLYTNKDEANTPLERPDGLNGRDATDFSAAELESLAKARQELAAKIAGGIGGAETGAGPTHWYEHLKGNGSRPWLIVDPPDGKLPAMTPQAQKREAAIAALNDARNGEGRADSWLDRSMYDRCITRGLPGSMMSQGRLPLPCRCSYQCVGPAPVSAPPMPPAIFAASACRALASDSSSAALTSSTVRPLNPSGRSSGVLASSLFV